MPVTLPSESEQAVKDSINRELKIVESKLERYEKQLHEFEEEYDMKTKEFIQKFENGELGDDEHWFQWKFTHNAVQRLKEKEQQLESAI